MLKIENVCLHFENFHRPALSNIHATIMPGDFVILIGGNGSGKSSLLKILNTLLRPSSGQVLLENNPLHSQTLESLSGKIVTLTQDLSMSTFGSLTVLENCILSNMRKGSKHKTPCELRQHLECFSHDLATHLHTPVQRLSGGQRQILALAMSLLEAPQILLLDEHTSALDPKTGHKVMEITCQAIEKHSITSIMITHELDDALRYGNRLMALKEGKIIFEAAGYAKNQLTKDDLLHLCY